MFPPCFNVPCTLHENALSLLKFPSKYADAVPAFPLLIPTRFNSPPMPAESLIGFVSTRTTPAIASDPYRTLLAPLITEILFAINGSTSGACSIPHC